MYNLPNNKNALLANIYIVKLIYLLTYIYSTSFVSFFCFTDSIISLNFHMLYNAFFGEYAKNETNSLFFFLSLSSVLAYRRARERENCKHRPGRPSPTSAILSPKGVLDWLSNVDTTTAELRNHVRHSTWSLIELSGISPALLWQPCARCPTPFRTKVSDSCRPCV